MSKNYLPPTVGAVPTTGREFLLECERLSARIVEVQEDMSALRAQVQAVLNRWHDGEPVWSTVEALEDALS